jgi:hypothetical protein
MLDVFINKKGGCYVICDSCGGKDFFIPTSFLTNHPRYGPKVEYWGNKRILLPTTEMEIACKKCGTVINSLKSRWAIEDLRLYARLYFKQFCSTKEEIKNNVSKVINYYLYIQKASKNNGGRNYLHSMPLYLAFDKIIEKIKL